jgi:hypothetical protein
MKTDTGVITFEMEGVTQETTERYRDIIDILIRNGALQVRNGKVILHFDNQGILREMEFHVKRYKRGPY